MGTVEFKAHQKWRMIPKDFQNRLLDNDFCSKCGVTTIIEYSINDHEAGIVLKGKCKNC